MGLVSESLLDTEALSSKPTLQTELCLNRLQRRWSCSSCAEICPHGVFPLKSGEELRWDRCTDCNLCVSACPTRALLPSAPERRVWAELPEGPIHIACRQEEKRADVRVGCLAAIPWELLVALALRSGLSLSVDACASCGHAARRELLQDNLERVRDFLGEKRCEALLRTDGETQAPPPADAAAEEKALTRRELFSGLRRRVGKSLAGAAGKRLPFLAEEDAEPLRVRLLLSETVNAELHALRQQGGGTPPDYGAALPRFNTNCFGCGICERICPHRALSIRREEGGTRLISIEARRCTGCLLCVRLCPHGGLDGLELIRVPHLGKLPLVRVKSLSCARCGAVLLPGTEPPLCRRCAEKEKKRRV